MQRFLGNPPFRSYSAFQGLWGSSSAVLSSQAQLVGRSAKSANNDKNAWTTIFIRTVTRKVAIVGSGPSGCYTAKYLLSAWDKKIQSAAQQQEDGGVVVVPDCQIDVIERLPTPYGLVRHGVAPDHPEVKSVQNGFDEMFEEGQQRQRGGGTRGGGTVNYLGNVQVGVHVSMAELRQRYDAVVVATGCESDRRLGLNGEDDFTNILSAREFVAWYNGHPDFVHVSVVVVCIKKFR